MLESNIIEINEWRREWETNDRKRNSNTVKRAYSLQNRLKMNHAN
jgi:hypothetical protein